MQYLENFSQCAHKYINIWKEGSTLEKHYSLTKLPSLKFPLKDMENNKMLTSQSVTWKIYKNVK